MIKRVVLYNKLRIFVKLRAQLICVLTEIATKVVEKVLLKLICCCGFILLNLVNSMYCETSHTWLGILFFG